MLALLAVVCLSAPGDVVFISVDTLRADHLGCYGYPQETSPHIDALAAHGLVFDDCICEVPLTAPSFSAMLTSRFPRTIGVHRNGLRLLDGIPTVAEQFRAAGWQTLCVQSNWTLKAHLSGINRGFEAYDDSFHKRRWGFIKPERYADEVTRIALDLLGQRDASRPMFLWVHYSDPHAPYRYHRRFSPSGSPHRQPDKRGRAVAKYDSEIAYADHHIGRLLDALSQDDTFVVFTADHGESLYEHNYLGHGRRIYHDGVHIPLILAGPGMTPGRAAAPVRGIDVGPTLLALGGLPAAPGMLGLDLLSAEVPLDRVRVIETYGGAVPKVIGVKSVMADRAPQRQGVILNDWKLIIRGQNDELYSLLDDPGELSNLAGERPDRMRDYRGLVEAWDAAFPRGQVAGTALSSDDIEALRSLGYVD